MHGTIIRRRTLQNCRDAVTIECNLFRRGDAGDKARHNTSVASGGSLDAHSKECVMQTSVTENELDLSELDALIREADKSSRRSSPCD